MTKIVVRVIDAYVFIQKKEGFKFLMLKRAETKIYEHLWQGVAGKIEKGETAYQAAIRELEEETGLSPKNMFIADHISRFYETKDDRINLVPVFGIEVDNEDVRLSSEHVQFKWVEYEVGLKMLVWNGQKEGISAVNGMINSKDDRMKWSEILLKE